MNSLILKNGHLLDPANEKDEHLDHLYIHNGVLNFSKTPQGEDIPTIDLKGNLIVPGLIDMHVHLREPGQEYKEDILSGTKAAACGGFTGVACMPNTSPVNDSAAVTTYILEKARSASAHVYPVGAISSKSGGESLAEYGEMKKAGAVAISDDGVPVLNSQLMRRAMEYSASYNLRVISHSEEFSLSKNGCMNEGEVSTRLGLKGIPNAAEAIMIYREIALAELTGVPIHIAHVSTKQSIELIRRAKEQGIPVTAETAPHYFTLTDEAVTGYNTNAKMNPPLRTEEDRQAVRSALADGTLDAIATDHAPHTILDKEVAFSHAANGIIGLETSLALSLNLVRDKVISLQRLVELLSINPAKILNISGGSLHEGANADLTVIDPERYWTYQKEQIASKSYNSPFIGREMQGKAVLTVMGGTITYRDI